MLATILPILVGALLILGAVFNIEYLLRFKGVRTVEALLGRTVQRVVVGALGLSIVAAPLFM